MKNTLIAIEEAENGFVVEINPYANNRRRAIFENTSIGHQKLLEWLMAEVTKECLGL